MCLAIPGQVTSIQGRQASVSYTTGVTNFAMISDEKVKVGDWVLVQMGIIIQILNEDEAKQALKGYSNIG